MFGCIILQNGAPTRKTKEQLHGTNQAAGASGHRCKQFTGNNHLVIKLEEWGRFNNNAYFSSCCLLSHSQKATSSPQAPHSGYDVLPT